MKVENKTKSLLIEMDTVKRLIHLEQVHIVKRHHVPIPTNDNNTIVIAQPSMPIPRTRLLPNHRPPLLIKDNLRQLLTKILRVLLLLPNRIQRVYDGFRCGRVCALVVVV